MGTPLTGHTPQSTYTHLLKVTGGLTSSLKTVEDGAGNSTILQLSTTALNVLGTISATTFSGALAWSNLTSKPTTLSGYGITDPVVLTSESYSNPSWLTALAWSKLTGTPTTLVGYGITDTFVNSLTGTANQISVSAATGAVTLSLPATVAVNTLSIAGSSGSTPTIFSQSSAAHTITVSSGAGSGVSLSLVVRDRTYTFSDGTGNGFGCGCPLELAGNLRLNNGCYIGMGPSASTAGSDVSLYRSAVGKWKVGTGSTSGYGSLAAGTLIAEASDGVASHRVEITHNNSSSVIESMYGDITLKYGSMTFGSEGGGGLFRSSHTVVAPVLGVNNSGYLTITDGAGGGARLYNIYNTGTGSTGGVINITGNNATAGATLASIPLTPTALSTNTNDWALGVARHTNVSASAAYNVTGIVAGANGQECWDRNTGSYPITYVHQSSSSSANNRLICAGNTDIVLGPGEVLFRVYDTTNSLNKWYVSKLRSDVGYGTFRVVNSGSASEYLDVIVNGGGVGLLAQTPAGLTLYSSSGQTRIQGSSYQTKYIFDTTCLMTLADRSFGWCASTSDTAFQTLDTYLARTSAGVVSAKSTSGGLGALTCGSPTTSSTALTIKAISSQNTNTYLTDWQNSTGTSLARMQYVGSTAVMFHVGDSSDYVRIENGSQLNGAPVYYAGVNVNYGNSGTFTTGIVITSANKGNGLSIFKSGGVGTESGMYVLCSVSGQTCGYFESGAASVVPLLTKSYSSQSGDVLQHVNSSGTVFNKVASTGLHSVRAGLAAAGTFARVGGTIFDHYADVGNVTTTETDLHSDSIAASTLGTNGDKLLAKYAGFFTTGLGTTRQIKLYFGGTAIFDSGALSPGATVGWTVTATIIRVSSTVVRYEVSILTPSMYPVTAVGELTGLTLSNANTLKITGTSAGFGAASNDIVAQLGTCSWIPAY